MKILCIDPGPDKCGFAILDTGEEPWTIEWAGHAPWPMLKNLVQDYEVQSVAIEAIIPAHGSNQFINKHLVKTVFEMGRLAEVCDWFNIPYEEMRRQTVIRLITGKGPSSKHKVTKADMQRRVKEILELDKVVRPQHANDAVCVGLAIHKFKVTEANDDTRTRKAAKKPRRKKSKA